MRKIILVLFALAIVSCKQEPKDYVTISGTIDNFEGESLSVFGQKDFKNIFVDSTGAFYDTIKVMDGFHGLTVGTKQSVVYLKNGFDLKIKADFNTYPNDIEFTGNGSGSNIYMSKKLAYIKQEEVDQGDAIFELEREVFEAKMTKLENDLNNLIKEAKDLDPDLAKIEQEANVKLVEFFKKNYDMQHNAVIGLRKGEPSPKFNYPNAKGENVSLDDFLGKYVYVDVWATWCRPCINEIPYLKDVQNQFQGKDIAFVSLSIDRSEHKDKWLKMVEEEQLQGVQIMADKDFRSDFVTAYNINAIPRFILIDKEGKIVNTNAPRPSDPRLVKLFNSLNL